MNTRLLSTRKASQFWLYLLFWIPAVLLSLLLVYNVLPYFTFDRHLPFLEERTVLFAKAVWRYSFYVHIAAGSICMLTAIIQFSSWVLKKRKRIHIISGRIYVFVVLLIGAPSGFYMTFFAKGGYWERACFMAMALFWFYTTYKGFVAAAYKRDFISHKFWMVRSYAMAMTAVTFRIYHLLFYIGGMNHFYNYSISLWISVIGNAMLENCSFFRRLAIILRLLHLPDLK